VIRQPHLGASRARTAGTLAARGRFVQYLDADDVLLPSTIENRVGALEASAADVAYCDWIRWEGSAGGTFTDVETVARELGPRPDIDLLTTSWWPPGALLYRRTLVDRIGPWREDLPIIQDARFALDAALAGARFVHVPSVGVRYRVHGDTSLSRSNRPAFLEDCLSSASQVHDAWQAACALDDDRRQALLMVYGGLTRAFFSIDPARSAAALARARSLDPAFVPGPDGLRALTRLVGYASAERLAARWRQAKTRWRQVAS
jgi:hypothetical protein